MTQKAEVKLRAALVTLLPLIDEIEADDWGLDATRDLRGYARATLADLNNGSLRAADSEAVRRLGRLGAELQVQSWAELWQSVPEWKDPMMRTEETARALHAALQSRSR